MMTIFPSEEVELALPGGIKPPAESTPLCRRGHKMVGDNIMKDRGYDVCKQCRRMREPLKGRFCKGCETVMYGGVHKLCLTCQDQKTPKAVRREGPKRKCLVCLQRKPLNSFRIRGSGMMARGADRFRPLCNECVGEDEFPSNSPWEKAIVRVNELTGMGKGDWWPNMTHPLHQLWYAYAIQFYEELPIKHTIKHPGVNELLRIARKTCSPYLQENNHVPDFR